MKVASIELDQRRPGGRERECLRPGDSKTRGQLSDPVAPGQHGGGEPFQPSQEIVCRSCLAWLRQVRVEARLRLGRVAAAARERRHGEELGNSLAHRLLADAMIPDPDQVNGVSMDDRGLRARHARASTPSQRERAQGVVPVGERQDLLLGLLMSANCLARFPRWSASVSTSRPRSVPSTLSSWPRLRATTVTRRA